MMDKAAEDKAAGMKLGVRIRLFQGDCLAYGKGVNQLLLVCARCHSLHKAAQELGMSYRKALQIVQRAEKCFGKPLLARTIGGKDGGGSQLTPFAQELVLGFSRVEAEIEALALEKLRQANIIE